MTLGSKITTTALDLTASLENQSGVTTPLTANAIYAVQNRGSVPVFLFQDLTVPLEVDEFWTELPPGAVTTIKADGDPIWARTQFEPSAVSVNLAAAG